MGLAMDLANMAKGGFLCGTIKELQSQIKNRLAEVQEGEKRGVEFPAH